MRKYLSHTKDKLKCVKRMMLFMVIVETKLFLKTAKVKLGKGRFSNFLRRKIKTNFHSTLTVNKPVLY